MRIRVTHSIGDLAADMAEIPVIATRDMADTVRKNVQAGERYAKGIARQSAGPHGKNYYKRISSEMTGVMQGEFGPHDGGTPVGAGFRHGPPNTDMAKAADLIGPRFARDVENLPDRWFWT
jgi:hypothetical protein